MHKLLFDRFQWAFVSCAYGGDVGTGEPLDWLSKNLPSYWALVKSLLVDLSECEIERDLICPSLAIPG